MDLQPLVGGHLVGADDRPDLVVEDLGGGAEQAGQAGRLEPQQVVAERLAEPPGPLVDLQGGEAVDVHARHGLVHGLGHVQVVVAVEAGVDAALEGDLGGPALVGLDHPPGHLVQAEQVGRAPQVEAGRALGEAQKRQRKVQTLV